MVSIAITLMHVSKNEIDFAPASVCVPYHQVSSGWGGAALITSGNPPKMFI